ncbi:Trp biosynthesis-associated membrane protein [Cellulomonas phragmiteti]|uniref:Tryptophan-associated transmembrane protein n=1 Tax=Cellulomonas phragmiteti TaxID=478780 RepID=A0ABQ4DJF3_9CELL|nr:Trp biosynthesis-associated membrane protein [Cellulomonas phragmiteti]GIG39470.1 hypothetical protein Cph01nite_12320 [Cellulomonas phragmiteti]
MTSVPAPTGAAAATQGPRRGRWAALLVLAAAAVGAVGLPTWVAAEGTSVLDGPVAVDVAGRLAAPQVPAAALVLLAAAGAVALVGRVGRWVVAVVVAGAGALAAGAAATVLADPAGAVSGAVADATGVTAGDATASATGAPVVALTVGVLVVVLAGALARAGGPWHQRSRRHERPAVHGAVAPDQGAVDERADWDALTRGDDPS